MRFPRPEVIREDPDRLHRERYRFYLLDADMVLDLVAIEDRKTRRHKWRAAGIWDRLDRRNATIDKPFVSQDIIDEALEIARSYITYKE